MVKENWPEYNKKLVKEVIDVFVERSLARKGS